MTALITVDLERVHPVFDGRWHHVQLSCLPIPGQVITTLCGRTEEVEYSARDVRVLAKTCWHCDLAYRRMRGIPVLPGHPALTG